MKRASGVLLHISSLPGPFGIGTLGQEAYAFVDQLAKAGVAYWQILPLSPTGPSHSPYFSLSLFANNPFYIDPRSLAQAGFLTDAEVERFLYDGPEGKTDFAFAKSNSDAYLELAYSRLSEEQETEMLTFVNQSGAWLNHYAMFSCLHARFGRVNWQEWPEDLASYDEKNLTLYFADDERQRELEYYYFIQWQFMCQWQALRNYANSKGVKLIGDFPIYPALNSADVWAGKDQFQLDEKGLPVVVAGVPPDYFSEDGQLWGNPLYNWDKMEEDNYRWWVSRVRYQMVLYDVIRIDHFRGFESYWAVPATSETARHGAWWPGPGMKLFTTLNEEIENLQIIAEDLGDINDDVLQLVEDSSYPGMEVMQFSLGDKEWGDNLPYRFTGHKVVYTGTHDNQTVLGWLKSQSPDIRDFALDYVRVPGRVMGSTSETEGLDETLYEAAVRAFIESTLSLPCILAVVPIQDLLAMDDDRRMNTPGTYQDENWVFRLTHEEMNRLDLAWLYRLNQVYQRLE